MVSSQAYQVSKDFESLALKSEMKDTKILYLRQRQKSHVALAEWFAALTGLSIKPLVNGQEWSGGIFKRINITGTIS